MDNYNVHLRIIAIHTTVELFHFYKCINKSRIWLGRVIASLKSNDFICINILQVLGFAVGRGRQCILLNQGQGSRVDSDILPKSKCRLTPISAAPQHSHNPPLPFTVLSRAAQPGMAWRLLQDHTGSASFQLSLVQILVVFSPESPFSH